MSELVLAFATGVLTIAAPCILPMLPILLGASVGQTSRTRPLFIALGFVVAFSLAAVVFGAFPRLLGLSPGSLRSLATGALVLFGVLLLWPSLFERLAMPLGGAVRGADAIAGRAGAGNAGGFVVGMTLGVVWTPCAGPVLGSILTLIAGAHDLRRGAVLLACYALGASVPMLSIAYGGQVAAVRVRRFAPYTASLQRLFGVAVIATAAAIHSGWDASIGASLSSFYPNFFGESAAAVERTAPDFEGIDAWLNSEPLAMRDLRGKVVLIDFWTYSCANCLRTIPDVIRLQEKYAGAGLVVIGVHTPEFPFERDTQNLRDAVARLGIHYPVAQDNGYATWRAYDNQAWPAQYVVDQSGTIVLARFGEGHEQEIENEVCELLDTRPGRGPSTTAE